MEMSGRFTRYEEVSRRNILRERVERERGGGGGNGYFGYIKNRKRDKEIVI